MQCSPALTDAPHAARTVPTRYTLCTRDLEAYYSCRLAILTAMLCVTCYVQLFGLPLEEMSPAERAELSTLMDRAERHWGVGPLQPGFNKTLATGKHACMRLSKKYL